VTSIPYHIFLRYSTAKFYTHDISVVTWQDQPYCYAFAAPKGERSRPIKGMHVCGTISDRRVQRDLEWHGLFLCNVSARESSSSERTVSFCRGNNDT
jgi:hypothetical protein